jgi:hypothetical protein
LQRSGFRVRSFGLGFEVHGGGCWVSGLWPAPCGLGSLGVDFTVQRTEFKFQTDRPSLIDAGNTSSACLGLTAYSQVDTLGLAVNLGASLNFGATAEF